MNYLCEVASILKTPNGVTIKIKAKKLHVNILSYIKLVSQIYKY